MVLPLLAKRPVPALGMAHPLADIPGFIPPDVTLCGPILQASIPLEYADEKLYAWVSARPTVLIVLGSHVIVDEQYATTMMTSLRILLNRRKDIQVLWKLQKEGEYELPGLDELGDRFRITAWLEVDPIAILRTGNVVCFVNHGGSNSYHEGLA